MFIKKYTIHSVYGSPLIDRPAEDVCLSSDKYPIGIAADGVTILERNSDGTYPVLSNGQSGPKKISDLFCQAALNYLEKQSSITAKTIKIAFKKGNREVRRANQDLLKIYYRYPNYGADAFATVAAIGCLIEGQLIYGFLTDCGVAVIDKKANLELLTPAIWSRLEKPSGKRLQKILQKGKGGYKNYRNYVRNDPRLAANGKFYSHGVINGQKGMIRYVEIGQEKIDQEDTIVVFTDGFRHYFQHKEFLEILAGDLNDLEKRLDFLGFNLLNQGKSMPEYGRERTLILLRR